MVGFDLKMKVLGAFACDVSQQVTLIQPNLSEEESG